MIGMPKSGTIAGTAHTQEYLLLHLAMFPIGLHAWSNVLGMPTAHQLQAQIIYRAKKVLEFGPITPAHRKPPWPGYKQSLRFFTKLLSAHPLVGICRPPNSPSNRNPQSFGIHGGFNIHSRS